MKLLAKLEPLRRWIDGGDDNDLADDIVTQARPRRLAEEFLVKVAREIGSVMGHEAFTPPGGPTYIPGEFIIFLSREDDKEWQGDKRRGLEQGLVHALRQRAADLFGQNTLNKPAFTIELRVDGTLENGRFRVKAIWDSETSKTFVAPRKGNPITDAQCMSHDNDVTVVSPRLRMVLYSLEVNRNNERLDIIPITKPEIMIGRGSQAVEVDVPIKGDAEVSRLHAVLARDAQGNYWLTAKGQNAVFINEREMRRDVRTQVGPNDKIRICSFELCIRPVASSTN
jgi:hypothetical protein